MASPIHLHEFVAALSRSPRPIAVANSAGPDSTCLLFLLRQLTDALVSIHVHHHLQPASEDMAAVAAANARSLGIPHHTLHVPWGVPPFPPAPTVALERTARDARYNLLFQAVTRARVPLLALGHHADDQLETALFRLARGSTLLGAAGMRPCRRWGMGSPHSPLAYFGHLGMDITILRPLLPFSKDRILATCRAHHLRYISDPTNFQPHITSRNAIRHCLSHDPPFSQPMPFPSSSPLSFTDVKRAYLSLRSIAPAAVDERQRLYSAVTSLASKAERIDREVSSHLANCVLPSPIGTLLLSSAQLLKITDSDVRHALVLRAIRYVSFHPWGSLRADADRRRRSLQRILHALWSSERRQNKFTAGGGVLWSPAIFNRQKPLRVGDQCLRSSIQPDDDFCWLLSRMPPFVKNPQDGASSSVNLYTDVTEQLRAAATSHAPTDPLEILYDCRFLLRIDPSKIPTHVKSALQNHGNTTSVKVVPFTRYYWPKVVLQHESHPDQVLAVPHDEVASSWISIQWIRPLDAT